MLNFIAKAWIHVKIINEYMIYVVKTTLKLFRECVGKFIMNEIINKLFDILSSCRFRFQFESQTRQLLELPSIFTDTLVTDFGFLITQ